MQTEVCTPAKRGTLFMPGCQNPGSHPTPSTVEEPRPAPGNLRGAGAVG